MKSTKLQKKGLKHHLNSIKNANRYEKKFQLAKVVIDNFFTITKINLPMFDERMIPTAILLLNSEIKEEDKYVRFNKAVTSMYNNTSDFNKISSFIKNKDVRYEDSNIELYNDNESYVVYSSSENDKYNFTNVSQYSYIVRNDKIYMILSMGDLNNNDIEIVVSTNIRNENSCLCPIVRKENINDRKLNGKNWVKHYVFNKCEGYLYFLKLNVNDVLTYKVGITKNSVLKRYKGSSAIIIEQKEICMNMLLASIYEQYIHLSNFNIRDFIKDVDDNFEGKNECYHIDLYDNYIIFDINEVIEVVARHNSIESSILKDILKSQGVEIYE